MGVTATTCHSQTVKAIGDDTSGNANDFTVNNLAASDVMSGESPVNNFATLNPLNKGSGTIIFSEGNLKSSTSASLNVAEHGATLAIPKLASGIGRVGTLVLSQVAHRLL